MNLFFAKKWLPGKRDKKWFLLMPPIIVTMVALLAVISKIQLQLTISSADIVIWAVMGFLAAAFICGFGYADLKVALAFSIGGVLAGILFMIYVFAQPIEAKGIVGLVSGIELAFIIIIVGINAQMIRHLMKKRRREV